MHLQLLTERKLSIEGRLCICNTLPALLGTLNGVLLLSVLSILGSHSCMHGSIPKVSVAQHMLESKLTPTRQRDTDAACMAAVKKDRLLVQAVVNEDAVGTNMMLKAELQRVKLQRAAVHGQSPSFDNTLATSLAFDDQPNTAAAQAAQV